jgi:hypothetical protein
MNSFAKKDNFRPNFGNGIELAGVVSNSKAGVVAAAGAIDSDMRGSDNG